MMKDSFPPALEDRSIAQTIFEVSFASLILIVAALENFLMLFVLYRRRDLRTIPNLFVLNLSVGNFLLAVTVLPVFVATLAKGKWLFSETFCKIYGYQSNLLFAITLFTITAISLNRYVLIRYLSKYKRIFNVKLVLQIICGIWICCAILSSAPLIGWGHFSFNAQTAMCHTDTSGSSFKITADAFMLVDITTVVFCHVRIVQTVKAHRRKITANLIYARNSAPKEEWHKIDETCNRENKDNTSPPPKQRAIGNDYEGNQISRRLQRQHSSNLQEKQDNVVAATASVNPNEKDIVTVLFKRENKEQQPRGPHTRELRGDEIHITRTTSLIVLVFCVCWLPSFFLDSMESFGVFAPRILRLAGIYLIFLDSVLGPFIYAMRVRKLKKALINVLKCGS